MSASKKPDLDDETVRIARTLLSTPPKPHDEMKIGKPKQKPKKSPGQNKAPVKRD
jgi:hypothetical protein